MQMMDRHRSPSFSAIRTRGRGDEVAWCAAQAEVKGRQVEGGTRMELVW